MTLDEFRQSLAAASRQPESGTPPPDYGGAPKAIAKERTNPRREDEGTEGAWVHTYLHRKEGDRDNADY